MSGNNEQSNFQRWMQRGGWQKPLVMVCFMTIPLLLLIVFTYLPFFKMIQFSLYKMKYLGARKWVGFDNYIAVFQRDDCFRALLLSGYYMVGAVIQLALALFFATLLSFKTKCSGLFKGTIFFPYLVGGIAVGFIFKFFYTPGFVLDTILSWVGFSKDSMPNWLEDKSINNWALVATSVWRYTGQNMILFIGAIMSVDAEMYEAADLDGANNFQRFLYIILPSIKTIVVLNLILSISGSLSAFEPPYVITGGFRGTETYFVAMDRLAHAQQKVGLASAMAVVLLVIIVIVTVLQQVLMDVIFPDEEKKQAKRVEKEEKKAAKRAAKGMGV